MVRLNKTQLSEDIMQKLFAKLNKNIAHLTEKQTDLFLHDLLGPEERVMLAKRLAIVVMLLEGNSLYKISETLKVSPSTAEKIKTQIEDGSFDNLISMIKKDKKAYKEILNLIENIITVGGIMPAYGKARI